ncbi:DUF4351 domain-containing protein [Vasconcelosia minhoensis]|uniref:DUF4351 domain-containing protein n=1 Tax=Vasconcelosia minhoensis TaxID=3366354 RepID=UPI001D1576CD|nr:DUF4351 domain-containing protein [Romeria gracilis]
MNFSYRVIQLNQLYWRDFLSQPNPVASALMAKMQIAPEDRPRVKAECLRLLVTLRLDPARMQLISGFIDTYLNLSAEEERAFTLEVGQIEPAAQEQVMEIVTSWMERGIEQGLEQGRREGELSLLLRLLTRMLGTLPPEVEVQVRGLAEAQIEQLTDRLPSLTTVDELRSWLNEL